MNNYEKIKQMSIEEMAEWFAVRYSFCELFKPCAKCSNVSFCSAETAEEFKQWLESEVENE